MIELKSEHLWPLAEDFTREGRWSENEDGAPNDFNTPDFVVRAMLEDLKALKAEVERLAELEPIPDWSKAPTWANYWSVDARNRAWWHERKPEQDQSGWVGGWKAQYIGQVYPDWHSTLRQRPKVMP